MGYSYSPRTKDEQVRSFFGRNGKRLAIVAVIVFLVAIFYATANTITTFATYSRSLEEQLNSTTSQLSVVHEQKRDCEELLRNTDNRLSACSSDLGSTQSSLNACNTDREKLNSGIKNLTFFLSACGLEKESSLQAYKQLARSSVKAICCSFGDVQSAAIRNWNIVNNSITCTGNYTVNCSSGETNY